MTPTAIELGSLTLMVGILALAQRLGGWESKLLARGLSIATAALFVAWCFLFFPSWVGWTVAALAWSLLLWFVFIWVRKSADKTREITNLNQDLFNARAQLADAQNELHRRDVAAALAEGQKREQVSALSRVPKLWVEYKPAEAGAADPEKWQSLTFSKEGETAVRTIQVGPLVWTIQESFPVELHNVIGPLRDRPVESKFSVREQVGPVSRRYELPDLFRTMMAKHNPQAQPSSEILYEDFDGNWFSRRFVLAIDPFDRVVWEPSPVQFAKRPVLLSS